MMEVVSVFVVAVAVAASLQALVLVAALGAAVGAFLIYLPAATFGWIAGKLAPGGVSPAPDPVRRTVIDLPQFRS